MLKSSLSLSVRLRAWVLSINFLFVYFVFACFTFKICMDFCQSYLNGDVAVREWVSKWEWAKGSDMNKRVRNSRQNTRRENYEYGRNTHSKCWCCCYIFFVTVLFSLCWHFEWWKTMLSVVIVVVVFFIIEIIWLLLGDRRLAAFLCFSQSASTADYCFSYPILLL